MRSLMKESEGLRTYQAEQRRIALRNGRPEPSEKDCIRDKYRNNYDAIFRKKK